MNLKSLLFLTLTIVSTSSAVAQDKIWDGGAGTNNWHDGANWNPNGVPGINDKVLIAAGADVLLSTNVEIKGLTIGLEYIAPEPLEIPPVLERLAETGSLTIDNGASLTTNGNSTEGGDGVHLSEGSNGSENTLTVDGSLSISGCGGDGLDVNLYTSASVGGSLTVTGAGDDGIELNDVLTNTGSISITNSDEVGINGKGSIPKTFTNSGSITISGGETGIHGSGSYWTFNNSGSITLSGASVSLVDEGTNINNTNNSTFQAEGLVQNGNNGDVNFQSGSTLIVGDDVGLLTFEDGVNFSGVTIEIDINATNDYDKIVVESVLPVPPNRNYDVILSNTTLNLNLNFTPPPGFEFMILEKLHPGPITGSFNGYTEGQIVNIGGTDFTFSYSGGDGNDMALIAAGQLPVELIDFNAQAMKDEVKLAWATATEIDNDFFTIERSADGHNFEGIATILGNGNTTEFVEYDFMDRAPLDGMNYYRLKQTDYDGQFSYSDIETVEFRDAAQDIKIYPSLVHDVLTVVTGDGLNGTANVVIRDLTGRISRQFEISGDEYQKEIILNDLVSGNYFISIYNNETIETRKFIKL